MMVTEFPLLGEARKMMRVHIELIPNHIEEPWESQEQYLNAHYSLIYEDTVAFRDAVVYAQSFP